MDRLFPNLRHRVLSGDATSAVSGIKVKKDTGFGLLDWTVRMARPRMFWFSGVQSSTAQGESSKWHGIDPAARLRFFFLGLLTSKGSVSVTVAVVI